MKKKVTKTTVFLRSILAICVLYVVLYYIGMFGNTNLPYNQAHIFASIGTLIITLFAVISFNVKNKKISKFFSDTATSLVAAVFGDTQGIGEVFGNKKSKNPKPSAKKD